MSQAFANRRLELIWLMDLPQLVLRLLIAYFLRSFVRSMTLVRGIKLDEF
ncbi:hypothetical protein N826_39420 [Skermanella aerolata KACC 11604]|nr:hypothetical protein N826_39420 [Skermanella aerolata KACC 11604]